MTMKIYGLSRSRDKKGTIVKQEPMNYVNCIHTNVGGGWETMWVLILEVHEDKANRELIATEGGEEDNPLL